MNVYFLLCCFNWVPCLMLYQIYNLWCPLNCFLVGANSFLVELHMLTIIVNSTDPRLTDYDTLLENIKGLKNGSAVQVPIYDFKSSTRIGYRQVFLVSSSIWFNHCNNAITFDLLFVWVLQLSKFWEMFGMFHRQLLSIPCADIKLINLLLQNWCDFKCACNLTLILLIYLYIYVFMNLCLDILMLTGRWRSPVLV